MKRDLCLNMETVKPALTQTPGSTKKKRLKSESSENNGIVCTVTKKLESITSTDDPSIKKTKECIGRFFYENGLDLDAVNSPSFKRMISLCSGQTSCQIPTCEELRKGRIFNNAVREMREYVDEARKSWADTGCSILLDGWTDAKGRNLVNILADCPKGTVYLRSSDISNCVGNMDAMKLFFEGVLTEVGIDNVVQVITHSPSLFMKEVGKQLTEKYRPIFWTVSASSCIELMLEKLEKMDIIKEILDKAKIITRFIYSNPNARKLLEDQTDGRVLVQPSKMRSAQSFLTLENIVVEKEILKKMFLSSDSKSSVLTSSEDGKKVANLMTDKSFWTGASTVVKAAVPLVRVIEWINKSNKEQIGYVYETIDQAKETIKEGFNHKKPQYLQFWKAIDEVWSEILYSPLHSAGYYLNPNLFYTSDMYIDPEVAIGLLCCVVRTTQDLHAQDRITIQIEQYQTAKGAFTPGWPDDQRSDLSPAIWWKKFGGECPELQRLAIRILSQTIDGASKFQLKKGLAETLLTEGRSQTEQKRLADTVFLQYNMQLQNFASGKANYTAPVEIDSMDDWILYEAKNDNVSRNDGIILIDLDGESKTDRGPVDSGRPPGFQPKGKTA